MQQFINGSNTAWRYLETRATGRCIRFKDQEMPPGCAPHKAHVGFEIVPNSLEAVLLVQYGVRYSGKNYEIRELFKEGEKRFENFGKLKSWIRKVIGPVYETIPEINSTNSHEENMLEHLVRSSKVFIDTCTLMHGSAEEFFYTKLQPLLIQYKKKVIVPQKVIDEIERLRKDKGINSNKQAEKGINILRAYIYKKLLDIRGERNDPFADNLFQYVFIKFRTKYNLVLLTQDRRLAQDILKLGMAKSIQSNKSIKAFYVSSNAVLHDWEKHLRKRRPRQKQKHQSKKFRQCNTLNIGKENQLNVRIIPKEGEFIETVRYGKLNLVQKLGEGGEGSIYSLNNGYVCKIYKKEKLTNHKKDKLSLMIKNPVATSGLCWPVDRANNQNDEFVGYIMPKASGLPIQRAVFIRALLEKNFPLWTRKNLVTLAIAVLDKIKSLHDQNVLIGDINPMNILINSDTDVNFVDTDSYQIEGYPCPVGMVNYTAPEIQGHNFHTFLRKPEHEYFAIATLLFMILLPGKPPFSHQGGGDPASNIKKGLFPYPFKNMSTRKAPEGCWRYIWSNLPFKTKEAFYKCFTSGKRLSPQEWLFLMKHYKKTLSHGHLTNEIYPNELKKVSEHAQNKFGIVK